MPNANQFIKSSFIIICFFITSPSFSQIINIGEGSYTTQFPGTDVAGRNTYPSGTPYTTGIAATKPSPTNDWWSAQIKNAHTDNLFNYPFTMKTINTGLVATYIPWGVIDDITPVIIGVEGLNSSSAMVSDFSDWTVTMDWSNSGHFFRTTTGIGMPFLYFEKGDSDLAKVQISSGNVQVINEMIVVSDLRNGADFAIYAPVGSTWTQSGNNYTSTLNGKNYWSLAFIPLDAANINAVANEYKKYAYVFPTNTTANWNFDENNSVMRTYFEVEVDVKEGSHNNVLQGLLPHQWSNLADDSPTPEEYSYQSIRGELKTLDGNTFTVENTFYGIIPTLPNLGHYSDGYDLVAMNEKVDLLKNDALATWTDSYNEGQVMNRLIQTARIADQIGNIEARDLMLQTIKERLEDWLSANTGEVAFIFYYNDTWTSMLGYPAGHGQDGNLNDHHFHWGYFIHAASFLEQFEPGWAEEWGEMVNLLVRDAASPNRDDELFPYLRNFSPYAGHCWANGFATFPQGNDQESTSESMQFNSSLIHWGSITGNDEIRDLGIYLYTTEQSAVEEYWFDMYERVLDQNHPYSLVSRVWGNSYDNGTFWTNDIAASYGIELYPIHGGSLYLGHNWEYAENLWTEITQNTGILNHQVNDNLWHDIMYQYLSFTDPEAAIDLYDANPNRNLKFGVSDAQTYHWLHAMNVLGRVSTTVTSNSPMAAVFVKDGSNTYVAHNYGSETQMVSFSDGFVLEVPAGKLVTSRDVAIAGSLSSSFNSAHIGGSVNLSLDVTAGNPSKVSFFKGDELLGEDLEAPYSFKAENLAAGYHHFYARIFAEEEYQVSNLVPITVGKQHAFNNEIPNLPGFFYAGHYDEFEGGVGQGVSYNDVNVENNGDYRQDEYVDCILDANEGATVHWIAAGEWIEYTVNVEQPGNYNLIFRYACDNNNGGGPFNIESDGVQLKSNISVSSTGNWNGYRDKLVTNIPLKSGEQVIRLYFENGELNIGKLTFSYVSPLNYDQPVADAGEDRNISAPTTTLNGSNSSDPGGNTLNYEWTQVYGPSVIDFSDQNISNPQVSGLVEGIYLMRLNVDNGEYSDFDEMYIYSSFNSVGELAQDLEIYYYPNPVKDKLFLDLPDGENQLYLYSLRGDLLDQRLINSKTYTYNMNHMKSGVYILKIQNQSKLKIFKVMK